ncbi:hypothetical protein BH10BAC3_BH10BAC3_42110 [soil metagenome]
MYKPLYHKGKLLLCFALALMAVCSCNKNEASIPEQTEKPSSSVQAMASDPLRPDIIVQETFEGTTWFPLSGTDLNLISTIENCGTTWTLSPIATPVFQDTKSSRFEIRKDQALVGSGDRVRSEATIIKGSEDSRFSPEMWYSFAVLFPSAGLEFDKTRDCFNQWYENGGKETTLRVEMDRAYLEVCPPEGSSIMKQYDLFATSLTADGTTATFVPIPKDTWHEFVFHIKHSLGTDGFIEVWRDGLQIHSITGRNIHKELPKWKLGLYKTSFLDESSPWQSRVIYFDNIRVGKTAAKFSEMSSGVPVATKPATTNIVPSVNAGKDTAFILPLSSVYLTGNGYDADGSVNTVKWSQVSGPGGIIMSGETTLSLKLKALQYGKYVFRLTVTDDRGGIGKDDILVNVTSSVNVIPTANAGSDKTISGSSTTLDGSKSVDPDGSISKYAWEVSSGVWGWTSSVKFGTSNAAATTVSGLDPGSYIFRLTITDNKGALSSDKVTITVTSTNLAPVAKAGADQKIMLPATLSLNGAGSTDADGTIAKYGWTQVSGPTATIINPSSTKTTVGGIIAGTYIFRLTVTDNIGTTTYDDVTVLAYSAPPITGFTLVNAATEKDILIITNGASYSLTVLGATKLNIRANTTSTTVMRIKFELTGAENQIFTDNASPFALKSDDGMGNYYYGTWGPPPVGTYTLKATPYSGSSATGIAGTAATIKISFTN